MSTDPRPGDEKLSEELGYDVEFLAQQLRFRIDLSRIQRGERGELGYVLMDRQAHPDVAVVFDTADEANAALDEHPLIDNMAHEDCLECYVPTAICLDDLAGREVILP